MNRTEVKVEASTLTKVRALLCPALVMLCVGSYYCYSNINAYVAAYLNSKSDREISDTDTLVILPVWLLMQSVFAIVSVRLADHIGYWLVNLIAFAVFTLANLAMSFVESFWPFVFVYGVVTGISVGLGYLPALYISWTYFPEKKSVVTGAIMFCSGFAGILLSPMTTYIVNPLNVDLKQIRYTPGVYNNVPKMFRLMALFFGLVSLVGCLLQPAPYEPQIREEDALQIRATMEIRGRDVTRVIKRELLKDLAKAPSEQAALILDQLTDENIERMAATSPNVLKNLGNYTQLLNLDMDAAERGTSSSPRGEAEELRDTLIRETIELESTDCPSFSAAFQSSAFYGICLLAYTCSMYNYFLNASWKKMYPSLLEVNDAKMSLLLSIGALCNSTFRLGTGLLLLKLSFTQVYVVNTCIAVASALTILHAATSYPLAAVYLALAFGGIGVHITLFPTICLKVFGPAIGPKIYPCTFFMFSLASMTQYAVLSLAKDDWRLMTAVFAAVSLLGLVAVFFVQQTPDWRPAIRAENKQRMLRREQEKLKALAQQQAEALAQNAH